MIKDSGIKKENNNKPTMDKNKKGEEYFFPHELIAPKRAKITIKIPKPQELPKSNKILLININLPSISGEKFVIEPEKNQINELYKTNGIIEVKIK